MRPAAAWVVVLAALGCDRGAAPAVVEAAGPAVVAAAAAADEAAPAMVGVLVPEAEVVLVAPGTARLARLELEVGAHVEAGAVVAEMDVRGDRTELAAATAAWKAAAAELERLELELEKARMVRADVEQLEEFVSKAELREQRFAERLADARKRSAGASVSQQRSKMEEKAARIAEAELRAPFAGVIASVFVDAGATLAAGESVVRLISDARVVRFAVPEGRAEGLRLGARVVVEFAGSPEMVGEVVAIAPEIEVGSRLIFAEARLLGGEASELRVGAVARVRFAAG